MALFVLFPDFQQLFVVVLSGTGWIDTHPDMLESLICVKHSFDSPGIDKPSQIIVHIERDPLDLRVPFQKGTKGHMGSPAQ